MNRHDWFDTVRLQRALFIAKFGASGTLGVVIVCAAVAGAVIVEWQAHLRNRTLALQEAAVRSASPANSEARAAVLVGEENFPSLNEMPGLVLDVMRAAKEHELTVASANYVVIAASNTAPGQYEMRFKANGSYSSIRGFVQALLNTQPAMAVRDLRFSRATEQPDVVEASIALVVFVKPWPTT